VAIQDIVVTLVFSIVLLGIMLYPSIKIADKIDETKQLSKNGYLALAIGIDIILSVIGGLFLSYF